MNRVHYRVLDSVNQFDQQYVRSRAHTYAIFAQNAYSHVSASARILLWCIRQSHTILTETMHH